MIKNNKNLLIITSIIILLPIIAGVLLWNDLPDVIVTHWNANFEPDGYMSKPMAVIGIPVFMLLIHWVCILATTTDKKNKNTSPKIIKLTFWMAPVVSVLVAILSYAYSLDKEVNINFWVKMILGVLFVIIGNYLPKCKQSYTIGIKVPWALNDAENWNKTHRFAGPVWVIGGALVILTGFVESVFVTLPIIIAMALIPIIYSYVYYLKHK